MAFGDASIRSLPRAFVPGATADAPIALPKDEVGKLKRVLRMADGDLLAVLPGDGTLIRCELRGSEAIPLEVETPDTESPRRVIVCQALPKGDKLDGIVRCCTELGVAGFVLFAADRSVARWDAPKLEGRLERYRVVAREAAEQSFRTRVPSVAWAADLGAVMALHPGATVLSEVEGVDARLVWAGPEQALVVGPEGGWSPREWALIGQRGVTLGPRVLRVDTAAIAGAALLLLG